MENEASITGPEGESSLLKEAGKEKLNREIPKSIRDLIKEARDIDELLEDLDKLEPSTEENPGKFYREAGYLKGSIESVMDHYHLGRDAYEYDLVRLTMDVDGKSDWSLADKVEELVKKKSTDK